MGLYEVSLEWNGETEESVARKGPGWPDAVGSSIPPLSWILEVGGDHHTR